MPGSHCPLLTFLGNHGSLPSIYWFTYAKGVLRWSSYEVVLEGVARISEKGVRT
jgi:hypothetical protein